MTAASVEGKLAGRMSAAHSDMKRHQHEDAMSGYAFG